MSKSNGRGYKSSRWTEHKYPLAFLEFTNALTFVMFIAALAIGYTNARHTDETLQHIQSLLQQQNTRQHLQKHFSSTTEER